MKRYTIDARKGHWNLKEAPLAGDLVMHADHAAFVERVREIAEGMKHSRGCPAIEYEYVEAICCGISVNENDCTCPRGQLLEVLR